MLVYQMIIVILSVIVVVLGIAIRNLLIKVEKYEDVTLDQTSYLQGISTVIRESGRAHV